MSKKCKSESFKYQTKNYTPLITIRVGIEGITYAGNHGLEILHPDGSKFVHPMPVEYEVEVSKLLQTLQDSVSIIFS